MNENIINSWEIPGNNTNSLANYSNQLIDGDAFDNARFDSVDSLTRLFNLLEKILQVNEQIRDKIPEDSESNYYYTAVLNMMADIKETMDNNRPPAPDVDEQGNVKYDEEAIADWQKTICDGVLCALNKWDYKGLSATKDSSEDSGDKDKSQSVFSRIISSFNKKQDENLEKSQSFWSQLAKTALSSLDSGITEAATLAGEYLGRIDARLQGSLYDSSGTGTGIYQHFTQFAIENSSALVSQKTLLKNIDSLINQGVAYNVESRATIATLANKLVTTFEVTNATLERLILVTGTDLTAAYAGAESRLNEMFNTMFNDTSYLSDGGLYDTVSSAISGALTLQEDSTSFLYSVQKWLGAMYEVGVSSETITNLASAINSLATGDLSGLSNNSTATLLQLSAENAGMNYADILNQGLNSSNINDLMQSVVSYLQSIASSVGTNVTKSAWTGITGVSNISDLRAVSNLTNTSSIYNDNITYTLANQELYDELNKVYDRTSIYEFAKNLVENAELSIGNWFMGSNQASNDWDLATYVTWVLGSKISGTMGTVLQTLAIASAVVQDGDSITDTNTETGFFNRVSAIISSLWNSSDSLLGVIRDSGESLINPTQGILDSVLGGTYTSSMTNRGSSTWTANGVQSGTSSSVSIGNNSYSDVQNSLANNPITTLSASTVTSNAGLVRDVGDIYAELFENQTTPIRVKLASIEEQAKIDLAIQDLSYIAAQAKGTGINVDLGAEDASTLAARTYNVRHVY